METKDFSFIILEALVSETGAFQLLRGYESTTAPSAFRRSEKNGDLVISLIGSNSEVLDSLMPEIKYPKGCTTAATRPGTALVNAAIPLHKQASIIRMEHKGNIIFESKINDVKPALPNVQLSTKDEVAIVSVGNDTNQEKFWIGALLKDGRMLRPAAAFKNGAFYVALNQLAGLVEARIVLEKTQDFRTSQFTSEPIKLPASEITGLIVEPLNGSKWPFGCRGSLIATIFDNNGKRMEWKKDQIIWRINGEKTKINKQLTPWFADKAGQHTIQLVLMDNEKEVKILDEVEIKVLPPSVEQLEYFKLLKQVRPEIEVPLYEAAKTQK
ncbi:hypothetical protein POV26_02760 [Aequorivita todarodis]|uniref:hypothetical protein n=1 Tax=Aequorivita todarodis TaxID=2036821 RepID=UPI002350F377|nr:hypothetical protein [Aequorivita todarodis]MDC7999944.1 hypothetical protein [Aequorivita todarodis]